MRRDGVSYLPLGWWPACDGPLKPRLPSSFLAFYTPTNKISLSAYSQRWTGLVWWPFSVGRKIYIILRSDKQEEGPATMKNENSGAGAAENELGGPQRKAFETVLRLVPVGLCISALVLILKSRQSNEYGDVQYADVGAFRYLAYANGICTGYSLLSAFDSAVPRSYGLLRAWLAFFFDQALVYVMLAAAAVATQVVYLAYEGDDQVLWSKVCVMYGRFCNKAGASLVITFVAVLCLALLAILSAYRLFSKYEPSSLPKEDPIAPYA